MAKPPWPASPLCYWIEFILQSQPHSHTPPSNHRPLTGHSHAHHPPITTPLKLPSNHSLTHSLHPPIRRQSHTRHPIGLNFHPLQPSRGMHRDINMTSRSDLVVSLPVLRLRFASLVKREGKRGAWRADAQQPRPQKKSFPPPSRSQATPPVTTPSVPSSALTSGLANLTQKGEAIPKWQERGPRPWCHTGASRLRSREFPPNSTSASEGGLSVAHYQAVYSERERERELLAPPKPKPKPYAATHAAVPHLSGMFRAGGAPPLALMRS